MDENEEFEFRARAEREAQPITGIGKKEPEATWAGAAKADAELGLTLASGAAQQIVGVPKHVAQLAESMTYGLSRMTPEQKASAAKSDAEPGLTEKLQSMLSYQPKSEEGKQLLANIQGFLSPVTKAGEAIHSGIASVAGEPAANVVGDVAGLAGMKGLGTGSALAKTIRTAESTQSRVSKLIDNLSGGKSLETPDVGFKVGESLGATKTGLKKAGTAAYQELDAAMGEKTRVPLVKSAEAANEYTTRTILDLKVKAFSDKLRTGEMSFDDLKTLRTEISDNMGSDRNVNRQLRGLRNAVTQDIEKAAEDLSPEARKAWDTANAKWKEFTAKEDELNKILGKKWEAKTPVEMYQKVLTAARNDPEKIGKLVDSIKDPGVRKQLAASVLHHMSDTGGNFDGDKFVRMWDTMNPQARKALFSSVGGGYEQNMTRLVENLRRIREGHRGLVKEVAGVGVASIIGHFLPGGTKLVGAITLGREAYKFGPKGIEAFLTSPRWVRYLAEKTASVPRKIASAAVVGSQQTDPKKYTLADQ
jgi:hypothetical protein